MPLPYAPDERRPPQDWNAKLHVVNASPLSKHFPRDRPFWVVNDTGAVQRVTLAAEATARTGQPIYQDLDGNTLLSWEIMGWTDSQEDAEEAAELLAKATGGAS